MKLEYQSESLNSAPGQAYFRSPESSSTTFKPLPLRQSISGQPQPSLIRFSQPPPVNSISGNGGSLQGYIGIQNHTSQFQNFQPIRKDLLVPTPTYPQIVIKPPNAHNVPNLQGQQIYQSSQSIQNSSLSSQMPQLNNSDLLNTLKSLQQELQIEASSEIFQKIQKYAALAASTAIALQQSMLNVQGSTSPPQMIQQSDKKLESSLENPLNEEVQSQQSLLVKTEEYLSKDQDCVSVEEKMNIDQSQNINQQTQSASANKKQYTMISGSLAVKRPRKKESSTSEESQANKYQNSTESQKMPSKICKIENGSSHSPTNNQCDNLMQENQIQSERGGLDFDFKEVKEEEEESESAKNCANDYKNAQTCADGRGSCGCKCSGMKEGQQLFQQAKMTFEVKQDSQKREDFNNDSDTPFIQQQNQRGGECDNEHRKPRKWDELQKFFSKLPCIKTCLTKYEVSSVGSKNFQSQTQSERQGKANPLTGKPALSADQHPVIGNVAALSIQPTSQLPAQSSKSDQLGLQINRIEDDFKVFSTNQISTADCKLTCDAQKICPELLPNSCDNYMKGACDCTVICKGTLKFLSNFVADSKQVAEIEDLCNIANLTLS
ncbi:hypothetical protein FGO68_gene4870 [Halteria grandinella]|uniref:Uncharacterized protein n=1 Tax=Halteria grandinella TaxID=5974 RepID=A0A8J8P1S4_HALGN|nr:hypothetical protein FGO68_gene4870 [Halteria grandinella]